MEKAAEMTQMNIRIPVDLKRDGDSVVARCGRTPSDVVRAVWSYMALHGKLPECVTEKPKLACDSDELDCGQRQAVLFEALIAQTGVPAECFWNVSRAEAKEAMYEELLAEYEALDE